MSDTGTDFNTPLGRIVWGHPLNPTDKTDQQTNLPVLNAQGEKIKQWSFGLAIPKADFGPMWAAMQAEAAKGYPHGAPQHFSWKYKDGDTGVDRKGKPYNQREGWAGCYVIAITTELQAPGVFVFQNGAYRQLQPNEIKTGDFVTAGLNLKVNVPTKPTHTPGLYINPMTVLLMFEGDEIKNSFQADPTTTFGAAPAQIAMPAGARPIGAPAGPGQAPPPGSMPGMSAPPVMPAMAPPPPVAPPVAPPASPQRPTDPSHIHLAGQPGEQWWINGAWTPAVVAPAAPQMPPPAPDFVTGAQPGMPPPRP